MSSEDILLQKKKIFLLVSLYSDRNETVHTGVEAMEGQELYDHLNKLWKMIRENKIMFTHEDMEEIVSEVINEMLEEIFDWEENGEVVYQGSNPRIVVERFSATAMERDDEEKVEDPGQKDRSQNSDMARQEQITLDQGEGHVTVIDASENGTAEIMAVVVEGQPVVENESLQADDSTVEVSRDVAEVITGEGQ